MLSVFTEGRIESTLSEEKFTALMDTYHEAFPIPGLARQFVLKRNVLQHDTVRVFDKQSVGLARGAAVVAAVAQVERPIVARPHALQREAKRSANEILVGNFGR